MISSLFATKVNVINTNKYYIGQFPSPANREEQIDGYNWKVQLPIRKSNTDSFIFLMNSDIDLIGEECREEKIIAPTPGRRKN